MAAKEYNGHHCWSCWNVALWIGNDESIYRIAQHHWKRCNHVDHNRRAGVVARWLIEDLPPRTADGAKYSHKAVKAAVEGMFGDE